ncbi:MAG: nitronate monooxygenase [Clostridia bacterium]|nr:nitronate monooxygenase [Clostridia bacterium]
MSGGFFLFELPELNIGGLKAKYPIIQGGMAIRISGSKLAGAVAREGGIGVIAGIAMSPKELEKEIKEAREKSEGKGLLGINVLYAVSNFAELIKTGMKAGIDLVLQGAGFSRDIYDWGRKFNVPIVPIVSSASLAKLAQKLGAAAVVVEGFEAGGHLGTDRPMLDILPEVVKAVKIPVIAAGGILHGQDIYRVLKMGAQGVQMGTRFAASKESGAPDNYKQLYLEAKPEDSILINSPVGLPGRGIRNFLTERLFAGEKIKINKCTKCMKKCSQTFCIREALENAQEGRIKEGIIFAGKRVAEIKDILSVKEIFDNLKKEFSEACRQNLAVESILP